MLTNIKKLDFNNETEVMEFLEKATSLTDFDLTRMQVKFVQNIVNGMNQTQAAKEAGTISKNPTQIGSEMSKTPKISLAIQWYGARMLQSSLLDRDSLIDKAMTLYDDCRNASELETARKTLELLMKAGGLLEKNPVKVPQSKRREDEDKEAPFQEYTEQTKETARELEKEHKKTPENNEFLKEQMKEFFEKKFSVDEGTQIN